MAPKLPARAFYDVTFTPKRRSLTFTPNTRRDLMQLIKTAPPDGELRIMCNGEPIFDSRAIRKAIARGETGGMNLRQALNSGGIHRVAYAMLSAMSKAPRSKKP